MFRVLVAGLTGNFGDAAVGKGQKVLYLPDSAVDDIIHTGNAEFLFVEQMEVPGADVELPGHFRYIPWKMGRIDNLSAQGQQFMIMRRGRMMQHIALELRKKNAEKLGNHLVVRSGGSVRTGGLGSFPGQKPEETVTVGRVRYRKGAGRMRETADKVLVRRKAQPVVSVRLSAGPVPDFTVGRIEDGAVGGEFFRFSVYPESGGSGGKQ